MSFTNPLTLFCASLLALLGTVPFTPFPSTTLRVDVIAGVDPVSATRFVGAGVRGTDWCTALSEEVHSPQLSTPNIGNAQTASATKSFHVHRHHPLAPVSQDYSFGGGAWGVRVGDFRFVRFRHARETKIAAFWRLFGIYGLHISVSNCSAQRRVCRGHLLSESSIPSSISS